MAIRAKVKNPRKKRRSAAQKAATKRLVAFNKGRRKKRNPTKRRKKTVSRKRRVTTIRKKRRQPMAKRRRKTVSRKRRYSPVRKRRRTKRNPSMKGIMGTLVSGLVTAGSTIGGLYAGTALANMAAGSTGDMTKKAQYRNLSRLALVAGAAFLLPKYKATRQYADAIVGGLMTALAMGAMKSVFGVNMGELSGDMDDHNTSYLLGNSVFDVSEELSMNGVSDMSGLDMDAPFNEYSDDFSGISEL